MSEGDEELRQARPASAPMPNGVCCVLLRRQSEGDDELRQACPVSGVPSLVRAEICEMHLLRRIVSASICDEEQEVCISNSI